MIRPTSSDAVTLACILSLHATGCSFLFSSGPPPKKERKPELDCSGYTLPVVDTVLAGWSGYNALATARTSQQDWDAKKSPIRRSTMMTIQLVELGIYGASALYGYYNAGKCSEAEKELETSAPLAPRMVPVPKPPLPSPVAREALVAVPPQDRPDARAPATQADQLPDSSTPQEPTPSTTPPREE